MHAINPRYYMFSNRKWNYEWKMLPPGRSASVLPIGGSPGGEDHKSIFTLGLAGSPTLLQCKLGSSSPHICVHTGFAEIGALEWRQVLYIGEVS